MRRRATAATILCILTGFAPVDAGASVAAGWKREALTTIQTPLSGITRVRDGVWRDTRTVVRLRARRVIDATGLPTERAFTSTTRCVRTWTTEAYGGSTEVLFLAWPDGRTLQLGLAHQRCKSGRASTTLPDGSFVFDDQLRSASLNARVGSRHFVVTWTAGEDEQVERTYAPDPADASELPPGAATIRSERFTAVDATVGGRTWWPQCHRASEDWFGVRSATCTLTSIQQVAATT